MKIPFVCSMSGGLLIRTPKVLRKNNLKIIDSCLRSMGLTGNKINIRKANQLLPVLQATMESLKASLFVFALIIVKKRN